MSGPPRIFDRNLLDTRRRRALRDATAGADFLLRAVAEDLLDRLAAVKRSFDLAADIGSPLPLGAAKLAASEQVGRVIRIDRLAGARAGVVGGQEALPLPPASIDLAASALAPHRSDELPGG